MKTKIKAFAFSIYLILTHSVLLGQSAIIVPYPWAFDVKTEAIIREIDSGGALFNVVGRYTMNDILKVLNSSKSIQERHIELIMDFKYYFVKEKKSEVLRIEETVREINVRNLNLVETLTVVAKAFDLPFTYDDHRIIFYKIGHEEIQLDLLFKKMVIPKFEYSGDNMRNFLEYLEGILKAHDVLHDRKGIAIKYIDNRDPQDGVILISFDHLLNPGTILIGLQDLGYELYFQDEVLVVEWKGKSMTMKADPAAVQKQLKSEPATK